MQNTESVIFKLTVHLKKGIYNLHRRVAQPSFISLSDEKEIKISTQETVDQFTQISQGGADYDYVPQVSGGSSDFEVSWSCWCTFVMFRK